MQVVAGILPYRSTQSFNNWKRTLNGGALPPHTLRSLVQMLRQISQVNDNFDDMPQARSGGLEDFGKKFECRVVFIMIWFVTAMMDDSQLVPSHLLWQA